MNFVELVHLVNKALSRPAMRIWRLFYFEHGRILINKVGAPFFIIPNLKIWKGRVYMLWALQMIAILCMLLSMFFEDP